MKKKEKMSAIFFSIGIGLIILGVLIIFISIILSTLYASGSVKIEGGFGGFIGPIPFGFFSSPRMFWLWLVITIFFIILWFILMRTFR